MKLWIALLSLLGLGTAPDPPAPTARPVRAEEGVDDRRREL